LSGFRTGYGEEICFVLFNLPILHLLRFDFDVINTVFTIFALHGHLLHSNLKLKAPKWLSFIACPHFHHWHHSTTEAIPNGQNFGATFTF
jgi:sterol desaturase/sphingolipid hydroxylase (fatty acid hydroxylase superfamily)